MKNYKNLSEFFKKIIRSLGYLLYLIVIFLPLFFFFPFILRTSLANYLLLSFFLLIAFFREWGVRPGLIRGFKLLFILLPLIWYQPLMYGYCIDRELFMNVLYLIMLLFIFQGILVLFFKQGIRRFITLKRASILFFLTIMYIGASFYSHSKNNEAGLEEITRQGGVLPIFLFLKHTGEDFGQSDVRAVLADKNSVTAALSSFQGAQQETVIAAVKLPIDDPENFITIKEMHSKNMIYNPVKGEFYLASNGRGAVLVVDGEKFTVIRELKTKKRKIQALALNLKRDSLIVIFESGYLETFNLNTYNSNGFLKIGFALFDVVSIPEIDRIYVTSLVPYSALTEIDTEGLKILRRRKSLGSAADLEYIEDTDELAVAFLSGARLDFIDRKTLELNHTLKIGFGIRALDHDPGRNLIYAGNFLDGWVTIVDVEKRKNVASVKAGAKIRSIATAPDDGRVYVGSSYGIFQLDIEKILKNSPRKGTE